MNAPLNLQVIKSIAGEPEFVLIPVKVFNALREQIENEVAVLESKAEKSTDYVPFVLNDYVDNPVALARIKAGITQKELAKRLQVTQAYISKIENQAKVTPKLVAKVRAALKK